MWCRAYWVNGVRLICKLKDELMGGNQISAHLLCCWFTFEQMCRREKCVWGGVPEHVCFVYAYNRGAITAHILQDRNLKYDWSAPREKKEMPHACLIRAMLPDTHALRWHMHTKGVVLGYLQTTSVNWSGCLEVKEEWIPPILPCLHLCCCRQRCI